MKKNDILPSPEKPVVAGAHPAKAKAPAAKPSRKRKVVLSPARRASKQVNGNGHGHGAEGELDAKAILKALNALKRGDFSARLPMEWTGMNGKVADTFNELAELIGRSTEDLSRVSRLVGKEGRIDERLSSGEVTGAWKEQVESVNTLITCLVHPISETARVIGAVAKGDLSQNMALDMQGRRMEGEF